MDRSQSTGSRLISLIVSDKYYGNIFIRGCWCMDQTNVTKYIIFFMTWTLVKIIWISQNLLCFFSYPWTCLSSIKILQSATWSCCLSKHIKVQICPFVKYTHIQLHSIDINDCIVKLGSRSKVHIKSLRDLDLELVAIIAK